jgi:hypothetical protein
MEGKIMIRKPEFYFGRDFQKKSEDLLDDEENSKSPISLYCSSRKKSWTTPLVLLLRILSFMIMGLAVILYYIFRLQQPEKTSELISVSLFSVGSFLLWISMCCSQSNYSKLSFKHLFLSFLPMLITSVCLMSIICIKMEIASYTSQYYCIFILGTLIPSSLITFCYLILHRRFHSLDIEYEGEVDPDAQIDM